MYNDQPPPTVKAADGRHAHSKGVLAFDKTKGFWIVSSVPRFPSPVAKGFIFSDSQTKFGQSILCVTVAKTVENILKTVFETTNPYIYDKKNFDIKISNPMNSVHIPIKTFGNLQLEILAKSASFGQDIHDKLISPKLADPLLVRTWRHKLLDTASKTQANECNASKEFRELHNGCATNNKNVPPKGICPNPKRAKMSP